MEKKDTNNNDHVLHLTNTHILLDFCSVGCIHRFPASSIHSLSFLI